MARIDLFTAPRCPDSNVARAVVTEFTARQAGIELHEWDLTRDPGPAWGHGIFATPSLLLDGRRIVLGVPSAEQLARWFQREGDRR